MEKVKVNIWDEYGKLTIIEEIFWKKRRAFKCKCECWNQKVIILDNLRNWNTTTCWCWTLNSITKHWLSKTRFNRIYYWINSRCNNKKDKHYNYYGWRWIKNEWKTFMDFKNDMYDSYLQHCKDFWEKQTTIDRIDSNWNYNNNNCKWSTITEQNRNTRTKIIYKWKHIEEWIKELWLNNNTVRTRLKRWWTFEKALQLI